VRTAVLALSFACVLWGLSFPATKLALQSFALHVHGGATPGILTQCGDSATLNGWRFVGAVLIYALLTLRQQRGYSRLDLRGGAQVGAFFGFGMIAQLGGLAYTLPSISAFLTSLVVVFVPVAQALVLRRSVAGKIWLGVLLALSGSIVMAQPWADVSAQSARTPLPFLGEVLTLGCAVLFSGQLLSLDVYGKQCNTARLTLMLMLVTAVSNLVFGWIFGGAAAYHPRVFAALLTDANFVLPLIANTLLASVIAIHLMNKYQPRVTPAMASVIYCLEPVFATLFSILLQIEGFSAAIAMGGVLILAAVLLVTLPPAQTSNLVK